MVINTIPQIHYVKGIAVKVIRYEVNENSNITQSEYSMSKNGYVEAQFDKSNGFDDHELGVETKVVPRSHLENLDFSNPTELSLLTVLGAEKKAIEAHLRERRAIARHLDIDYYMDIDF